MAKRTVSQSPALFEADELAETPAKLLTDALEVWNEFATKNRWKTAKVLDSGRRTSLRRAVKDYGGLVGFRAALQKVERNKFIMGKIAPREGFKQFVATLDWFIRPVTVRKVLEDFYEDDGAQAAPQSLAKMLAPTDDWSRWLRDYRLKGFWPTSLGPRPEDPACRAPAAMLQACRERLGIVVATVKEETRAERLTAMIGSYRRAGNHDRANNLEEELARLENRPPVLVPAPEVAMIGMPEQEPPANPGKFRQNSAITEALVCRADGTAEIRRVPASRADAVSQRMAARVRDNQVPDYDGEPIGDYEIEAP